MVHICVLLPWSVLISGVEVRKQITSSDCVKVSMLQKCSDCRCNSISQTEGPILRSTSVPDTALAKILSKILSILGTGKTLPRIDFSDLYGTLLLKRSTELATPNIKMK